jgi:glycosyltransferase involved in cell wall biosynthesis
VAERLGLMAAEPTISVVIPAFQAAAFVAESIESVLAQDRPAHEVVVVDDGSTDGTVDVVRGFGDAVTLVQHAENRGEGAARNTGLAAASGDLIAMHDADDRMLPHRLRVQLEHLVAGGPQRGCVVARTRAFDPEGRPLPEWAGAEPESYGPALVLAWRGTYDVVGDYDEALSYGADADWLVRVKAAGLEVHLLDEVLTERRVHDANMTALNPGGHRSFVTSLRKVLAERRSEA